MRAGPRSPKVPALFYMWLAKGSKGRRTNTWGSVPLCIRKMGGLVGLGEGQRWPVMEIELSSQTELKPTDLQVFYHWDRASSARPHSGLTSLLLVCHHWSSVPFSGQFYKQAQFLRKSPFALPGMWSEFPNQGEQARVDDTACFSPAFWEATGSKHPMVVRPPQKRGPPGNGYLP